MSEKLKTPILFLIFNRLDATKEVFQAIRKAAPNKLYIASDGPRVNVPEDSLKVAAVREFVNSNIDWDCEVKTLFREKNLGCKLAVSGAINWFFDCEEQGIILEDDCLPSHSFFVFCEELLDKYKNNKEIAIISGNNFNLEKIGEADYYFSKIPQIWGWATWKRTWEIYDLDMSDYNEFKSKKMISKIWQSKKIQFYWLHIFNEVVRGKISTWDYQLTFSCFLNSKLSVCPNVNLVSNIGFDSGATNTILRNDEASDLKAGEINFPLVHPKYVKSSDAFHDSFYKIALRNFWLKLFLKKIGLFKFFKNLYTILFIKK